MLRRMPYRQRVLFINEGSQGSGVMGQEAIGGVLRALTAGAAIEARHISLPTMGRVARLATRGVPPLARLDLDAHPVRWQLVQALRARRVLREELARSATDLVHLNGHTLGLLSAGQVGRVPTLLSVDSTIEDWHAMGIWRAPRPWSRATLLPSLILERRAFARAARVLAWTEWARRGVLRACPSAPVAVHHPGLDLERFSPAPRRERERPRLLFVGGRFREKGGEELIATLGGLLGTELELDVVTPEPVPRVDGVRVHRHSSGAQPLVDLYQQADLLCLPTRGDAAPFAVLEAMACATPVVAYDVGAVGEMLGEPACGAVVPRGDMPRFVAEIRTLLADPQARERAGAQARSRCEAKYDARNSTRALLALMEEVSAGAERG